MNCQRRCGPACAVYDDAAQLASAAFLLIERELELFIGEQALLNEQIAEANLFRASHGKFQLS